MFQSDEIINDDFQGKLQESSSVAYSSFLDFRVITFHNYQHFAIYLLDLRPHRDFFYF